MVTMFRLMNKNLLVLFVCVFIFSSCGIFSSDDDEMGDWKRVSSFEGLPRTNAVSFVINDKAYVGTGYNGDEDDVDDRLKDFWAYDPELNHWTQRADFPGRGRSAATGFAVGGKGYIGTGYNDDVDDYYLGDFWAYNPQTNSWDSTAAFGGGPRYGAVGFALNGKGYVGTGNNDNDLKDFWRYDPAIDEWTQVMSLPGDKRIHAVSFIINDKAYVGTGRNSGIYEEDFFVFDPENEQWTRLHNIDEDEDEDEQDIPRSKAVAFSLNGKGYITLGEKRSYKTDIWKYDPVTDTWTDEDLAHFEGNGRNGAVAFTIGDKAYVGTGSNGVIYLDDMWDYDPTIENDEDSY